MSLAAPFDPSTAQNWFQRWERQQELYAGDRIERFEAVLDTVEAVCSTPRVVIDLGCGPGSLAVRVAERFGGSTVVAVDHDPFLVALGQSTHRDIDFVVASIGVSGWTDALEPYRGRIDAIVSSTALHYPPVDVLANIYRDCATVVSVGGVLVNADEFYPDDTEREALLNEIHNVRLRRRTEPEEDWGQWWAAVDRESAFRAALAERAATMPVHTVDNGLSAEDHISWIRHAGFRAVGCSWQHGRSAVLTGIR